MKALGKKSLSDCYHRAEHYRQALIEAVDYLDKVYDMDIADLRKMAKKLRVSAGVKVIK